MREQVDAGVPDVGLQRDQGTQKVAALFCAKRSTKIAAVDDKKASASRTAAPTGPQQDDLEKI